MKSLGSICELAPAVSTTLVAYSTPFRIKRGFDSLYTFY